MSGTTLSTEEEDVLLALAEEERKLTPRSPIRLGTLAELLGISEKECSQRIHELARLGLASEHDFGPRKSSLDMAALTQKGTEMARRRALVDPNGPVQEFAQALTVAQLTVLDVVVAAESRVADTAPTRTHVRTSVRRVVGHDAPIEEITAAMDSLVGTHLSILGGKEPSYRVTLRGLLASRWGDNALEMIDGILRLLRDLLDDDPGLFRFSWKRARPALNLRQKALNLFSVTVAEASLGNGVYIAEGDAWWATPAELDVVLEHSPSAVEHVRRVLRLAASTEGAVPVAPPARAELRESKDPEKSLERVMVVQTADPKKVFVIHGRNLQARSQMGIFLRACGLLPINFDDLRAEMGGTPTIAEIVERGMSQAQGVVALFTADEYAGVRPEFRREHDKPDEIVRWQSRPNVIFEAGMAFGRDRTRVVFVLFGNPVLFTDVSGIHVLRPTNEPHGDRKTLREILRKGMGCTVEDSTDWMTSGDFETCIKALPEVSPQDPFLEGGVPAEPPVAGAASSFTNVSLDVSYKKLPNSDGKLHHYELAAVLRNGSRRRIDDWYIEVELPSPLEEPHVTVTTRVRSHRGITLFRTSDRLKPILAGEEFRYAVPYRMDNDVFDKYQDVLDRWVARARAFVGGEQITEVVLKEIQNF